MYCNLLVIRCLRSFIGFVLLCINKLYSNTRLISHLIYHNISVRKTEDVVLRLRYNCCFNKRVVMPPQIYFSASSLLSYQRLPYDAS